MCCPRHSLGSTGGLIRLFVKAGQHTETIAKHGRHGQGDARADRPQASALCVHQVKTRYVDANAYQIACILKFAEACSGKKNQFSSVNNSNIYVKNSTQM